MGNRVLTSAVLLLIALVGVWACAIPHLEGHVNQGGQLTYFRDDRTELCFAYGVGTSFTNVPCYEKVKELLR